MFYLQGVQLLSKIGYSEVGSHAHRRLQLFPPLQQRHLARRRSVLECSMTVDQPFACGTLRW